MDPITRALSEYNKYLNDGGQPVDTGVANRRAKKHKLHPSGLGPGLCDRSSCYSIMEDTGEIEPDIEHTQELLLSFRVGHVFQDFVAQALSWKGALVATEVKVEDKHFTGSIDLVVEPRALIPADAEVDPPRTTDKRWVVDVKAVKGRNLDHGRYYPKGFYVAQLEKYRNLLEKQSNEAHIPILYVVTRLDLKAHLYWWEWLHGDCICYKWGDWKEHKTLHNLQAGMELSESAQLRWLETGELPSRCGQTPDEHPFKCCEFKRQGYYTDGSGKKRARPRLATPKCKYFLRCWEVDSLEPFTEGEWNDDDMEPTPLPL